MSLKKPAEGYGLRVDQDAQTFIFRLTLYTPTLARPEEKGGRA